MTESEFSTLYRENSGRLVAYLYSILENLSVAQEICHEVMTVAFLEWQNGRPDNPLAWLHTASKNKAIDHLRHQKTTLEKARLIQALSQETTEQTLHEFEDEQLKLIFTCCHPAIDFDKQVALTLNTVCGFSTEQIANALLLQTKTLEQRLTRAKRKIKSAKIPFQIPEPSQLSQRINAVLKTIYLVFNAGTDREEGPLSLHHEAMRLVMMVNRLLPGQAEVEGLQALMYFHQARRLTRLDASGNLCLLEDQDRSQWDLAMIQEADITLQRALKRQQIGSYQLQAAIQGVHCLAKTAEETDWRQIESLYQVLLQIEPSPVIQLNLAVAKAMSQGLDVGLAEIAQIESEQQLSQYSLLPAAKADLLRRQGEVELARKNYQVASSLAKDEIEQNYYHRRLKELG